VTVVAGNGTQGYSGDGVADGAQAAMLHQPTGLARDSAGNLYNQTVGTTSAPKSVTVTNTGAAAVSMGSISLSDKTDFAISSNTCPASGHPNSQQTWRVSPPLCAFRITASPQKEGI
jgi:hypothetical protein